ncbi:BTAD domain-containing putative transcriptional regulator [Amycolatopsis sp. 195334CR]|uniref:BTAD domain-containing putative transcriptional regulator n=1 Tax=Amycolatopsis sp. 195334CR TaxID=2814588 RepID=UPI001A8C811C|nr:BTAD domain-containing putative transcriptional regulator [Amycolatopsis sp. 195334CR]MBN6041278.1 AAA family ATPase [Amycolatopsis sp. 195334CR]
MRSIVGAADQQPISADKLTPVVAFRVLGPLAAENAAGPVGLKGPRHQAVLARLLVARGRVVPVTWLIDDLWNGNPPDGALGAVQTFVGALRKALEPDRPPRTPSRLLVTASPGYALRAEPDAVDAWRFEAAVAESARLLTGGQAERARLLLDDALALWRGPAYAEFAEQDWARAEADRLTELRLLAVERRAEAATASGQAAESVPDLRAHVAAHPLREDGWRLLALALYRSGRQGDALATLRRAREVLRTELGVDPGAELRQVEADILAQEPRLSEPVAPPDEEPFVGRDDELDALVKAALATASADRPGLVLLSGSAGVGKTALASALTRRLGAMGWATAWGGSVELPSVPGGDLAVARFRRQRAMGEYLAKLGGRGPVVLVFDDLHWADEETLALLTGLATDPGAGPVLLVGTYRSTEISAALTEALGRAARAEPLRIYLEGLTESQVAALVTALSRAEPPDARVIHRRSGGNPFFVRELARLWEDEGDLHAVPAGVREVIRHRLAALAETTHLRQAAVLGEKVELDLLIALAGDEDAVLASVESAVLAGFLVEADADFVHFGHALVRETLYEDISRARRARWHIAVAELIEQRRPGDVAAIAHHFLRADSASVADRAAHYARAAAEAAERRSAPHEAARLWREVVARSTGRARLEATMGLVRALAVTGELAQARRLRAEAVTEAAGDPVLTARVLGSFDVPAIWTANDDEALSARLVAAAERVLAELPEGFPAERARLLITIAMERRADAGGRGEEAAAEAVRIARSLADPGLLALALNGLFLQTFHRAGLAPERGRIGAELVSVSTQDGGLVAFEVLGHLIQLQSAAAVADLPAADQHAAAADQLAERYELPLVGVFTSWYAALRLTITGGDARPAYHAAAARLAGTGMSGLEPGILPFALLDPENPGDEDCGPYEPWVHSGQSIPDSPRDLLFEARTCLHVVHALRRGETVVMERLYAELLPAAGELAGAGSGLLTFGPVARYLGDLATALGRPEAAAHHYHQAEELRARPGKRR